MAIEVAVQELNGPYSTGGVLLVATTGGQSTLIPLTGRELILVEADGALEIEFNSVFNERGRSQGLTWDIVDEDVVMIGPLRPNAWRQAAGDFDFDLDSADNVYAFRLDSRFSVR